MNNKLFFISILYSVILIPLTSCDNHDDVANNLKTEKIIMSGITSIDSLPLTYEIDGFKIIFQENKNDDSVDVRTRSSDIGPTEYIKGDESKIKSNEKVSVKKNCGRFQGIYLCDVYEYRKVLMLPLGVRSATVDYPSRPAFSSSSSQDLGVSWTLYYDNYTRLCLRISYYTIKVNNDMIGRNMGGEVFPLDGKIVEVPYRLIFSNIIN